MRVYVKCPRDGQRTYFVRRWPNMDSVTICGFCGKKVAVTDETVKEA
jgi:hypothetical protein